MNPRKKILLHGPLGQGTTNDKYYFTVLDKNGDAILHSAPHETRNVLLQNVSNFQQTFAPEAFDIDAEDLGNEAPNTEGIKAGELSGPISVKTGFKVGRPTLTEGSPSSQKG
jgi:hypothetical protein